MSSNVAPISLEGIVLSTISDDLILLGPFVLLATAVSTASILYGIRHGEPWYHII